MGAFAIEAEIKVRRGVRTARSFQGEIVHAACPKQPWKKIFGR